MASAYAADPALQAIRERLDYIGAVLDSTENTLKDSSIGDREFVALRDTLNPLRAELRTDIGELQPRYAETQKRLKELGPPPKEGQPPEDARITVERATQTSLLAELDSTLKQAKLLAVRGDQISARIDDARRSRFKQRVLSRSENIFSPSLWLAAAEALPGNIRELGTLFREWRSYAIDGSPRGTLAVALAAIAALIVAAFLLRRLVLYRIDRSVAKGEVLQNRRSRAAYLAIMRAVINGATPPLTAAAVTGVLSTFDLVSPRVDQLTSGVLIAIGILSVGCAVTAAMATPAGKMIGFSEAASGKLYRSVAGAIAVVATATFVFTFHRVLGAPAPLRSATSALMALLVGIFLVRILLIKGRTGDEGGALLNLTRLFGWAVAALLFGSLATGYINLAAFTAVRLVDAAIIGGAAVLLLALVNSVFAAGFSEEGSRRRKVASALGVSPARLDLLATIIAGVLRTLLLLLALFLIVGGWRTSVTDVASTFDNFDFAVSFGQSRLALGNLLLALGVLVIGLAATRIAHRWLNQSVLPRSGLDIGLQNSISTMFVYLGVIAAGLLALSEIGINLQNIAFVAGALSVGIGFGLQSIVSNFVSGIILLAERPIRLGDLITVKGEQGYVRRISVRATEIETLDRANVIIPNSEFISNVVTNWTHTPIGRVTLNIAVSTDTDPKKVREVLLEVAGAHSLVMKSPPPSAYFVGYSASSLDFQLFCVVSDVSRTLSVKSDLYFRILEEFRTRDIRIPSSQQELVVRGESPLKPA